MRIIHVVGARPNFMKVAPVMRALGACDDVRQTLVHTGQHYDENMSAVFFAQLRLPEPDVNLEAGSGSHARQTADVMSRLEPVLMQQQPGLVLVYGDVNSTVAAALVCVKLLIPVGHVEAGLRSFDRTMPEEINRLLTDQIADLLFTPSTDADQNLLREGVASEKIHFVGNVMIDSLVHLLPKAKPPNIDDMPDRYAVVTLHRPSNVDAPEVLRRIIETLIAISRDLPVIFPVHPRTRGRIAEFGLRIPNGSRFRLLGAVSYLEFLGLLRQAAVVLTDSGGIQEETTYLGVPCITLRSTTERPVTISIGTNVLVGDDVERLRLEVDRVLRGTVKRRGIPPLWDGRAAERIADVILAWKPAGR